MSSKKRFFKKLCSLVSRRYITIYWFLPHVVIMFYVSLDPGKSIGNNYRITRPTKNILTQEKDIFSVWSKSNVDEAQIYVERRWPKNQPKPFLVHISSLRSFTLELTTLQIFWSQNSSGMIWAIGKMGENEDFGSFLTILGGFGSKSSENNRKIVNFRNFHPALRWPISFPISFVTKIFRGWLVQE